MLEECGASYRMVPIDFTKGENKTPEFLKLNPMGKLPALTHGGTVVTEVAAICTYLADAFPDAKLAPFTGPLINDKVTECLGGQGLKRL